MSTLRVDTITDEAGTGAVEFPNGFNVSGGTITGLPEAGVATFTASGDVTAKSATQLNTDGTVSEIIAAITYSANPFVVNTVDVNTPASTGYVMVAKLTPTSGVAVAHSNGAANASAYYFSVDSSGNITLGSPITLGNDAWFVGIDNLFTSNTNQVCFCYQSTSNYAANVIVITVSGTSLSASAQSIFVPQASIYNAWTVGTNGTGGILFGASNSTGRAYLRAGVVQSGTISLGGETQVTSNAGKYVKHIVGKPSTDDWAVFLHDTSNQGTVIKATASGTSVTGYSSEVLMSPVSGVYTVDYKTHYDPSIDKFWYAQQASGQGTVGTFTMPSTQTTITLDNNKVGFPYSVNNITSYNGIAWAGNLTNSLIVNQFRYNGPSTAIDNSNRSMPSGYTSFSSGRYGFGDFGNYFVQGGLNSTSQFELISFSALDSSRFVGISDTFISNGSSGDVVLPSGIVEGLTGLEAGKDYNLYSAVPQEVSGGQVKALSSTTAQVKF